MKKNVALLLMLIALGSACSSPSPEEQVEEEKVDEMLQRDQERADSFKRAMEIDDQSALN